MSLSIAREIAYNAFEEVFFKKQKPDTALEKLYLKTRAKRLDRNLAKEILYGSLRWYSKIFWILQNTSNRDLLKTDPAVQTALILGTYQIFYMDRVPDRAAVNESVNYVKTRKQGNASSFVNGILRQIARRAEYFTKPNKTTQKAEYLALQFSFPQWIVERWLERFKFERMEVMLAAMNQPPIHFARVNAKKTSIEQTHSLQHNLLKEEKTKTDKRPLRTSLAFKEFPKLDNESLFGKGFYSIQNESSQLIALLLDLDNSKLVVDACCGKAGKTAHIAELSSNKTRIIGIDPIESQLELAKKQLQRLDLEKNVELIQQNFLEWNPESKADRLLIDAPCSGLGVLNRHPEGKWHKTSKIIKDCAKTQKEMLDHGLSILETGGQLVYSVCSFEPEETTDQLSYILEKYKDSVELVCPTAYIPDYYKKYVTRDNLLLIYAGNDDCMDGFGAFILKKRK